MKKENKTNAINVTDENKKLSVEEMEKYGNSLNSNFYNAMIGEVVNIAIVEEKKLSIKEIREVANRLCDNDELNNIIDEIILENFE